MDPIQCMNDVYSKATSEISDLEIWPGYYQRRHREMNLFFQLFPSKTFSTTLELGCGLGYQSAMLSCLSQEVIATDVDFGKMKKHSRGINVTREFIERIGKKNIEILVADAQELPFSGETFDFIYSSYSFQYVPDKTRALKEVYRVLKQGGYFFCVLPTSVDRIDAGFNYYINIFKLLFSSKKRSADQNIGKPENKNKRSAFSFRKLFPSADDDTNSFVGEMFSRFPANWKKLFKRNGYGIVLTYHTAGKTKSDLPKKNVFARFFASLHSTGFIIVIQK